jgi:hypothetical protein
MRSYRSVRPASLILSVVIGLIGVTQAVGQQACRPALAVKEVQFSAMQPPTLRRTWTAVVAVDASQCATNSAGHFEIVFTRLSETAPDFEFRKRFEWRPPMVNLAVDFGADEAVQRYRIDTITPCACRD